MDKIKLINSMIKIYEHSVQEIEKRIQEGAILSNDEVLQDYKDILNTYKEIKTDLEEYEEIKKYGISYENFKKKVKE